MRKQLATHPAACALRANALAEGAQKRVVGIDRQFRLHHRDSE
jgi:hypothetical protein